MVRRHYADSRRGQQRHLVGTKSAGVSSLTRTPSKCRKGTRRERRCAPGRHVRRPDMPASQTHTKGEYGKFDGVNGARAVHRSRARPGKDGNAVPLQKECIQRLSVYRANKAWDRQHFLWRAPTPAGGCRQGCAPGIQSPAQKVAVCLSPLPNAVRCPGWATVLPVPVSPCCRNVLTQPSCVVLLPARESGRHAKWSASRLPHLQCPS